MEEKALKINLRAPLNEFDTETQTYGCRANNPSICNNCYLDGVCAFVTNDHICRRPSRSWKKIYHELLNMESKE